MLSVILLSIIMVSAIIQSVVMLNIIRLSVVILNGSMLSVVLVSVKTPDPNLSQCLPRSRLALPVSRIVSDFRS